MTIHRASLLRQATTRVLATLLAALLVTTLLVIGLQQMAMERSAHILLTDLKDHYETLIVQMEASWQTEVSRAATHLNTEHLGDPNSAISLTSSDLAGDLGFLDRNRFPVVLLVKPNHHILFKWINISINLPEQFTILHPSGWYYDAENARLFRWYAQPVRLGTQEKGQLVLFVAIEHDLLSLNSLPHTDLFLRWNEQTVASSLGIEGLSIAPQADSRFWAEGIRHDQVTLPWNTEQDTIVRLVIQHHIAPLFSNREIVLAGLIASLVLALLFWWSLGTWLIRLTQRIASLKNSLQTFSQHHIFSPIMHDQFSTLKQSTQDEIVEMADSMEQLAKTVVRHNETVENHAHQLAEGESRIRAITQSLRDALVVFDAEGTIQFSSHVCLDLFGWSEDELLTRSLAILFAPHWFGPHWQTKWLNTQQSGQTETVHTLLRGVAKHRAGREFPVEIAISQWQRHGATFYTAIIRDISELKLLENRDLRAYVNRIAISALLEIGIEPLNLHRKLEVALEIILTVPWLAMQYKGSIFLATEDDHLEMVAQKNLNDHLLQACKRIPYGFCLCGKAAQSRQIVFSSKLDARHDVTFDGMHEHGHYCIPILLQEKLLGVLNLYVDYNHPHDPEEEAFLSTIANTLAGVIDRALADNRVQHLASHDTLTGLPNRMLFHELLEQELRRAVRDQQTLAVAFLDLDHFKTVNDTFGHEAGDLLLKAASARTRQQLRDSDLLARMGGDEFTLILPNIADQENAITVCNKIVQALNAPFMIEGNVCQIGASIGLALFPAQGQSVETLLQAADQAMYVVKKGGRNGVVVYTAPES